MNVKGSMNLRFLRIFFVFSGLLLLSGCGKVDLLSNLPEKEANEIVSIMQQYKVPVTKRAGLEMTWTITLSNSEDFSRAIKILNAKGYPKQQYATMGQVFQKSGLVSSPLEERARLIYALSENLSQTLNDIPGVLSSRVHIVLPENDPYSDNDTEASAAIFLTYKAGGNLDESVREIKYLVANSVQGLDYDRVSIALFPVNFDDASEVAGNYDNVSVIGLSMSADAAPKFLILVIILVIISLVSISAAVFFFFSSRRGRHQSKPVKEAAPKVVQSADANLNELDEEPEE